MKKRAYIRRKRAWFRAGVWVGAATLLVLSIGWLFPALAATPAWWDCDYGYRKQITVTAGSSAVPANYSTTLTFDHATLVTAGKSQTDGDDVRVVYWNGTSWVELDRFLDPDSTWNNSATKVWFKVQAAISSSSSDGNYYLYYGHPSAVNPPAIPNNIFFFYDGYESGNFSAWSETSTEANDTLTAVTTTVFKGTYAAEAAVDTTSGGSYARVENNFTGQNALHLTTWIYLPDGVPAGEYVSVLQTYTGDWTSKVASVSLWDDEVPYITNTNPASWEYYFATTPLNIGQWNRLEMKIDVSAGRAELWLNGVKEVDVSGKDFGSGDIDHTLENIFWKSGSQSNETLYFDESFDRVWVDPEPTTGLGTEEVQDCTPVGFPVCTYQYRKQITVTANGAAVPVDYAVSHTFDHAALVSAGKSLTNGDDIRIVYNDGAGGTDLDRWLDPDSSWNSSTTRIWYKLQAAISSAGSDGNYYMYYGDPSATNPLADPTKIFFFYDGYESGTFSAWGGVSAAAGDTNTVVTSTVHTGTYAAEAVVDPSGSSYARVENNFTGQSGFHSTVWVYIPTTYPAEDDITVLQFYTGGWTQKVASLAIRAPLSDMRPLLGVWTESPVNWQFGSPALTTGAWHRLEQKVIVDPTNGRVEVWQDGVKSVDLSNVNTGTGNIDHTLENIFWKSATTNSHTLYFDNSFDRVWVDPEPTVTLGPEETVGAAGSYFSPDAAAAGMNVPVTFVGNICVIPTITTSSSDIIVGPTIVTDANGNVVAADGKFLSTVFFVKPDARPATGITVYADGSPFSTTFDIVIPAPDPNVPASGSGSIGGRTKRGTKVLGGLTVGAGGTLTIDTGDTDGSTPGNQGYLPAMILAKGDVNIAGTVDVNGQNGANGGASSGGAGGVGGPGGGGGGGGGAKQDGTAAGGGHGFSGGGGGGSKGVSGPTAIAFDNANSYANPTGTTSFTVSYTLNSGSGNNRKVLVSTGHEGDPTPAANVTGITFDGAAMSSVGAQTVTTTIDNRVEMWEINDADLPASSGTYDVVITTDADPGGLGVGITSWTGVAQQVAEATNSATLGDVGNPTISANITTLTDGALIASIVGNGQSGTYTHGTGQDERWDINPSSAVFAGTSEVKATAGTETVSHTSSDPTPNRTTMFVAAFAPPAGGGGGSCAGGGGGDGTGAVGSAASSCNGGAGGSALSGATGGGSGLPSTETAGGDGGGGGTGDPVGAGGGIGGPFADGAPGGTGGGGGGATGGSPGGGGGGAFATAGGRGPDDPDAGYGGNVTGNAQLVPLAGGSGGAGGGPNKNIDSVGAGGGGAGGAILLYATGSVSITGTMTADGGDGGAGYNGGAEGSAGGGGGSGGSFLIQSGDVTASGTLTTAGGAAGAGGETNAAGGAGGSGRIRIDGLASGSTVPGTAGSKFIGPVIDTLVDTTVSGRADGGSSITLYLYDETGAQVTGSPYTTSASGSTGSVGTWSISSVTFSSGTGYLAVKQTSGSVQVFGPGRATRGIHLINWREVY